MALKAIQKEIKKNTALFITNPFNISYISNFTGTNGQLFITAKKAFLLTDFRYLRVAKAVLPENISVVNVTVPLAAKLSELCKTYKIKTMHFEDTEISFARYNYFKKSLGKIKFEPFRGVIEKHRVIKTAQELALIVKAQRITEKVFLEVRKNLKPGKTEKQIAWEIEQLGHMYGADTISFPPIVGFGANSGSPHHQNSDRKLKKGEIVLIDMGMKYKGYCSDMTRMIFTAKPTPLQAKIYNTVLEAQEAAIKKLHAGVLGSAADKISRDIIKKAGYGKTFGHSLGHGIGLEVHESPSLSTGFDSAIPENTVVTVEPGIYLENSFGVRIEDMLLVKRKNVVNLTKIPKKIEDAVFLIS